MNMWGTEFTIKGIGDEVLIASVVLIPIVACFVRIFLSKYTSSTQPSPTQNGATDFNPQGRLRSSHHDCSICLGETTLAVETNCGHVFCGACIFTYYSLAQSGPLTAPSCPYCRQRITVLLPFFTDEELHSVELEFAANRSDLLEKLKEYNRRFSGEPRTFLEQLQDIPMLLRHLWTTLWSNDGLYMLFRIRILLLCGVSIIYILSPFDIIPEVAFGIFGYLDDMLVFGLFLLYATILFRNLISQGRIEGL